MKKLLTKLMISSILLVKLPTSLFADSRGLCKRSVIESLSSLNSFLIEAIMDELGALPIDFQKKLAQFFKGGRIENGDGIEVFRSVKQLDQSAKDNLREVIGRYFFDLKSAGDQSDSFRLFNLLDHAAIDTPRFFADRARDSRISVNDFIEWVNLRRKYLPRQVGFDETEKMISFFKEVQSGLQSRRITGDLTVYGSLVNGNRIRSGDVDAAINFENNTIFDYWWQALVIRSFGHDAVDIQKRGRSFFEIEDSIDQENLDILTGKSPMTVVISQDGIRLRISNGDFQDGLTDLTSFSEYDLQIP